MLNVITTAEQYAMALEELDSITDKINMDARKSAVLSSQLIDGVEVFDRFEMTQYDQIFNDIATAISEYEVKNILPEYRQICSLSECDAIFNYN